MDVEPDYDSDEEMDEEIELTEITKIDYNYNDFKE
jgi:hypothetical protein